MQRSLSSTLIIDNYDSFTYNLVHQVESILHEKPTVWLNNQIRWDEIDAYDKIILSPGPGLPNEAGDLISFIHKFASSKSMLGVCLGHQAIAETFGASLKNLKHVFHGVSTPIQIIEQDIVFNDLEPEQFVGRYHSWVIDGPSLPSDFIVTSKDENGDIMSMRHAQFDVYSVQFHPESVLTPNGNQMMANWLKR